MKKILLIVLVCINIYAIEIYDISADEFKKYKQNPHVALENLKNKYFYKKNIQTKKVKPLKISKKAHIKEKKVLYDKQMVIKKLGYTQLMATNDTRMLVKSIVYHLKDSAVDIDAKEITTVLEGIRKKRFTKFESNLYLTQLRNYMKE